MLLSVIIPYYNADAWIGRLLESLVAQDLDPSDYEIIVVDDGSDKEPVVLQEYVEKYPQIACYPADHGGMSSARNYGLSLAKGEWVYFCDSDDFLQPRVIGGILQAARERDLEMIAARFVKLDENAPIPAPRRNFSSVSATMTGWEYLVNPGSEFTWAVWTMFVKRAVVQAKGLAFEDIYYVEDRLFKFALLQSVTRMAVIDVDLYYYVQHEGSFFHEKRKQNNPAFIDAFFCYMERLNAVIGKKDTPPEVAESLRRRLHNQTAPYVLTNAFAYSPLQVNASTISRLAKMGYYPVLIDKATDSRRTRFIRHLMNHRRLWLLLYRIVHLLPDRYVYRVV